MMDKQRHKNNVEHPQGGVGRISNTGNADQENKLMRDISHIDQQEGEMNNGETGGNFSREEESTDKKEQE